MLSKHSPLPYTPGPLGRCMSPFLGYGLDILGDKHEEASIPQWVGHYSACQILQLGLEK